MGEKFGDTGECEGMDAKSGVGARGVERGDEEVVGGEMG